MIGYACEQQLHWAIIYVGFGFISVALTGTANIGMTYVMDSCFAISSECKSISKFLLSSMPVVDV